jgi:cold shock protein
MQSGKIKWFDDDKGYGFIVPDDGSGDVFIHKRDVQSSGIKNAKFALKEGRPVTFRSEDNPRGGGRKIARHIVLA